MLLLTFSSNMLRGQQAEKKDITEQFRQFDQVYGLDQNLVNGVRYIPEFPGSEGHPFLDDEPFLDGELVLGGAYYNDVALAYDIYNQNVIMRYTTFAGAPEQIILPNQEIQEFNLGNKNFRRLSLPGQKKKYYQVFEAGTHKCYFYWSKSMNRSTTPGGSFYVFTAAKRKFFLLKNDNVSGFKSKGGFIKLFPSEHRKSIKTFFRENHIILKQISDSKMKGLLEFCDDLPQ